MGGANVDPIQLIRRIRNGLEIPGLKEALVKVLRDLNVQISLLEGTERVLDGDVGVFAGVRGVGQTKGFGGNGVFATVLLSFLFNMTPHQLICSAISVVCLYTNRAPRQLREVRAV